LGKVKSRVVIVSLLTGLMFLFGGGCSSNSSAKIETYYVVWKIEESSVLVRGRIRNLGTKTADNLVVSISCLNKQGHVFKTIEVRPNRTRLIPHDITSFWASFPIEETVKLARVKAECYSGNQKS
jgi:hypothetical protein